MERGLLIALMTAAALAGCDSAVSERVVPSSQPFEELMTYEVAYEPTWRAFMFKRPGEHFFLGRMAEAELSKFEHFFSQANMAAPGGKRIYCDCKVAPGRDGWWRRIEKATLYAR